MYTGRITLHWRHNDHDGVSNHQPHGCLLNRLFRHRSKKTSKLRVTGLCVGHSPGPVNSPHKGPVARKMFPFDDVIMKERHASIDSDNGFAIRRQVIIWSNDGLFYWRIYASPGIDWLMMVMVMAMMKMNIIFMDSGNIFSTCPANERRCYNVTSSLRSWAHTQSDSWDIRCFPGSCGGTFSGPSGSITSPNYPNDYANNLDCVYHVNVAAGKVQCSHTIYLVKYAHGLVLLQS